MQQTGVATDRLGQKTGGGRFNRLAQLPADLPDAEPPVVGIVAVVGLRLREHLDPDPRRLQRLGPRLAPVEVEAVDHHGQLFRQRLPQKLQNLRVDRQRLLGAERFEIRPVPEPDQLGTAEKRRCAQRLQKTAGGLFRAQFDGIPGNHLKPGIVLE